MAAVVLATAYGVIRDQTQIVAWTGLVTALLGNGLAMVNTTTKPVNDESPDP